VTGPRFAPADAVRVKALFPPGHVRTPFFTRGKHGRVVQVVGAFGDPERLAYGDRGAPPVALYRVRFDQAELWPGYDGAKGDTLIADIYETWLEPTEELRP
jgi:nitrile hydratase